MNNNAERDTKKSIDRLSIVSSSASSKTFDLVDKSARKISDVKEERKLQFQEEENRKKEESNLQLQTSEGIQENEDSSKINDQDETTSRMKTNVNNSNEINSQNETTSRIKTNVNNEDVEANTSGDEKEGKAESISRFSKLKTSVSKATQKTFKFNDNQGKVSKTFTVIGKTGNKISKTRKNVTKVSRELNKMMSSDGTGTEYINDKIGRKVKTTSYKIAKKGGKKIQRKFSQTIGKKLAQIAKTVLVKILKLLLSLFTSSSLFAVIIGLAMIIVIGACCIFGSSSSGDKSITDYSSYMASVQSEYNTQVDTWKRLNPNGIVVGVNGDYGQIDWRIPLAIMQSTGAELSFDSDEKALLDTFKNAGLFEKHEVVYQEVENNNSTTPNPSAPSLNSPSQDLQYGQSSSSSIPVLVITNGVYEDYLEWLNNNYSKVADFNKKKKVTDGSDKSFSDDQKEMLSLLYQSDDFAELLGNNFITNTPVYGKNEISADLKSDNYNSKNALTIAGYKGQCTWYAFGRALETSGKKMPTGNAQTWLTSAITMGYKTGTQPSANSVVVLMGRKFGHVAYVEAYDGKSITISEGNVGNACSNDNSCSQVEYANNHAEELVRTKTYSSYDAYRRANKSSGLTVVGFIYLDNEKENK